MFKLEMHCHSQEVSVCSTCPANELAARYIAAGYDGIVLTNHINRGTYENKEDWSWKKKTAWFMDGFHVMQDAAGSDLDILLGCEINLTPVKPLPEELQHQGWLKYYPNDYLIYGVTEEWLKDTGDMRCMTLPDLSRCVREAGMLIIHAHAFRCDTLMTNPELMDGYEVFNGNARHDSHNFLAEAAAERYRLIKTSGSDFHRPDDPINGGILTERRIRSNGELLKVLKSGGYDLLGPRILAADTWKT